ncbi:rod shape-determining protein MreC [Patescibacteria group bacterium]|nr:rod shape-determining protein MreC [Patescibacteria group bacterium]
MNRQLPVAANIAIAVGLVVLLVLLNAIGILKPIESIVGLTLEPITKTLQIRGKSSLEKENADLQQKVGDLEGQLAGLKEAKLENDALRNQLGFAQTGNYKLTQASIISQDPTNYQQILTIDRGSSSGIKKDMVAVTGGLLVGRIVDTTPSTAKVQLITDFSSAVPVLDQETRASGLVHGARGFGLELEMVPQTDQLKENDTLITSGFGGEYPKGLVVGNVGKVTKRDPDVFQSAEVRPAADFRKLESVFIITGQKS